MKKWHKTAIIVLISIVCTGVLLLLVRGPRIPSSDTISLPGQMTEIKPRIVDEQTNTYHIEGTVYYTGNPRIDTQIDSRVDETVTQFTQYVASDNIEEMRNILQNQNVQYTLSVEGKVIYVTDQYISYRLDTYEYTGGAHGNPSVETFVFDRSSGQQVLLKNLFIKNSGYLEKIATVARENLHDQRCVLYQQNDPSMTECSGEIDTMLAEGTQPSADNFASFLINDQGITFVFQAYQTGPYVLGQPEVTIPWSELSGFTRE